MSKTSIEWVRNRNGEQGHTINPIRARLGDAVGHYCEKLSAGCKNCYASALQRRFAMPSFQEQRRSDVKPFLDAGKLEEERAAIEAERRAAEEARREAERLRIEALRPDAEKLAAFAAEIDAVAERAPVVASEEADDALRAALGALEDIAGALRLALNVEREKGAAE